MFAHITNYSEYCYMKKVGSYCRGVAGDYKKVTETYNLQYISVYGRLYIRTKNVGLRSILLIILLVVLT